MKTLLLAFGKDTKPYGLLDIYMYLKEREYDVQIMHLNESLKSINSVSYTPDIVGITMMTLNYVLAVKLIKLVRVKWPKAKVVLGGRHFNDDTIALEKERMVKMADHIVVGEGEHAMEDIINDETTDQIIYGKQLTIDEYKAIPFPNEKLTRRIMLYGMQNTIFTRGCPFNCIFCCEGRSPLARKDPDAVVSRLKQLRQWSGGKRTFLYDDVFAINKRWLRDFRDEIKKQNAGLDLRCFIHGKNFDEEMCELLRECKISHVSLGAECGDDEILKLINKTSTTDDFRRVHKILKGSGITLHCMWMLGNIGETNETMRKTVELSKEIGTDKPWFSYALPFPGTEFWRKAEQYGTILQKDYTKWSNTGVVYVPHGMRPQQIINWYNLGRS